MTSGFLFLSGYMELGPQISASLMKTFMICLTILFLNINIMHSWNSKGEFVKPVGREVIFSIFKEVRKVVIS